jgi:hypothetical protein
MPTLSNLPPELIIQIARGIDQKDKLALRHTSKRLVVTSAAPFMGSLQKITVTCSKAGLARLAAMTRLAGKGAEMNLKRQILGSIEHVVIHTLSASRLVELAQSLDPDTGKAPSDYGILAYLRGLVTGSENDQPFLRAYMYMQTTLVNGFNAMPNLKLITVTNENFEDKLEPTLKLAGIQGIDPLLEAAMPKHHFTKKSPRLYAYESVLSVVPSLKKHDVKLDVIIDFANTAENLGSPMISQLMSEEFYKTALDVDFGVEGMTTQSVLGPPQQRMFHSPNFSAGRVIHTSLRGLSLRNKKPDGTRTRLPFLLSTAAHSALTHLELDGTHETAVLGTSPKVEFPKLTTLTVRNHTGSYAAPVNFSAFIARHQNTLQELEFVGCEGDVGQWEQTMYGLARLPELQTVKVKECEATDVDGRVCTFNAKYDREVKDGFECSATDEEEEEVVAKIREMLGEENVKRAGGGEVGWLKGQGEEEEEEEE